MVASLQKQKDSCDVRAIEVTVKAGKTVINTAGAKATVGASAVVFNAVDLPAGILVLDAFIYGLSGSVAVGLGTTTAANELLATATANVVADNATKNKVAVTNPNLLEGRIAATTPLYLSVSEFDVASDEITLLIRYVILGSSEYNI